MELNFTRSELLKALEAKKADLTGKNIYIWGAGNTTKLYQEGLSRYIDELFDIKAYVDNSEDKWGMDTFAPIPIISPQELSEDKDAYVLICSYQEKVNAAVNEQLNDLGIAHCFIDEYILKTYKEKVIKVYDLLDDSSKNIYAELVLCKLKGIFPKIYTDLDNQYFPFEPFSTPDCNEVFVDCGAYIGDTIEDYIKRKGNAFDKIIAFEPDLINYNRAVDVAKKYKSEMSLSDDTIVVYPYGVGESNSKIIVESDEKNDGIGSMFGGKACEPVDEADENVKSIDGFIKEKITFLKADIESYEYKMIMGAKKHILEDKPMIAVCIYHNVFDFFDIPLLINDILPSYRFAVRHHTKEMIDTVFYAWKE